MIRSSAGAMIQTERIGNASFDTLVVAGGGAPREGWSRTRCGATCCGPQHVRAASLAYAPGLRAGRRRPARWQAATTHWRMAAKLQQMHPQVKVDSDRIYCAMARCGPRPGFPPGSTWRWP
jgi:transcriptional regulator GlxA family with amidase domain